ncbi:TetR/AcrR family transcriptional regulator [Candidatus Uabimicrobium amorphum]|uniref:TetR family transcriptional regulator n=1 Tax=Uabimicrobium amorphum TaxID=2596890 RepID=A0A5S9ISG4_UABAM|nr:TetR/AcrR family transcriptional regulator [Candidatus Uabimicrobium amorphum]BBM86710.1 TetR family transcriptional regulator [Candidatus Uabimicrobium amorphum]
MPRLKEYHKEDVLHAAMNVFWEKGFHGTSVNDLVKATGLNKHSMYKEFGNKEGLFKACIDNYVGEAMKDNMSILLRKPLGFENIKAFFYNCIDILTNKQCKSCFLVNSVAEKEVLNEEINSCVKMHLVAQEKVFYDCLQASQQRNEIAADKDLETHARLLMCFLEGMSITGKIHHDRESLHKMVERVFSLVTSS